VLKAQGEPCRYLELGRIINYSEAALINRVWTRTLFSLALMPWLGFAGIAWQQPARVDFAKDIAPIFKSKCANCHGKDVQSGGLRLDTVEGIRKGGVTGRLFEPFKSADSLLLKRILGKDGQARMPMGFAPLSDQATAKITTWIDQGAVMFDPKNTKHWAYLSPKRLPLPAVGKKGWVRNPIDSFVLARLEKEGLSPSPEASRETLARRAALDLTGLPPTVQELDQFLADKAPGAYERYVDRLLASPHYGERMARIWLDLARYADTNGYEKDLPRQMSAWRDWVIGAFNRNLPYDQFTVEQLAGDLLPNPTRDQLVATGFHRNSMLNDEGGIDAEEFRVIAVIDRVDTTATTWLGSTLACAQCHDHKYDPFSQRDFYSFFAFFNQSEDNGRDMTPILRLPTEAQTRELTAIDTEIEKVNHSIAEATPALTANMADWDRRIASNWVIGKPEAKAEAATLTVLDDSSVLASGTDLVADTYVVEVPTKGLESLAGVRIEAIPDPSLPQKSSGRDINGNFVISRVDAQIRHADGSLSPVAFKSAKADFSQQDFNPQSTIGAEGLGWAIAGFQPENRVLHQLFVFLGEQIPVSDGDHVVVTLKHAARFPHHNVGRFRISLTSDLRLGDIPPPVAEVQRIIEVPVANRTKDQQKKLADYYASVAPELSALNKRLKTLRENRLAIEGREPTTLIMRDLQVARPNKLLKRGDFRTPGESVLPASPKVMGGPVYRQDRLGLAKWIVSPKNPLTARVEVNRLWEQCFGRGLVATPEDFGSQGEPPTHPELLDWMATEMIGRKWDVKAMLRLIVTSATYRQSSRITPKLLQKDPNNLLLARGARFRVEAEMVRDVALAASGRLTPTIGGPSVMPPQPPGIWENSFTFYDTKDRWVDETGPNRYRRGLYTYWRRTAPFPMALTFDLKSRDMCVAHRFRTNTPLQALNTLNDPLFVECAGKLGVTMAKRGLAYGFRACTSRAPKPSEVKALEELRKAAYARFSGDGPGAAKFLRAAGIAEKAQLTTQNAAWIVVANTILNLDETITRG
jgi:hypothetical protein